MEFIHRTQLDSQKDGWSTNSMLCNRMWLQCFIQGKARSGCTGSSDFENFLDCQMPSQYSILQMFESPPNVSFWAQHWSKFLPSNVRTGSRLAVLRRCSIINHYLLTADQKWTKPVISLRSDHYRIRHFTLLFFAYSKLSNMSSRHVNNDVISIFNQISILCTHTPMCVPVRWRQEQVFFYTVETDCRISFWRDCSGLRRPWIP